MLNISNWIDGFLEIEASTVPIVIFGNKIDLRNENSIPRSEVDDFIKDISKKYGFEMIYIETSALTGENVISGFETLVKMIAKFQDLHKLDNDS